MKIRNVLVQLGTVATLGSSVMTLPSLAHAGATANVGVSNMYLWRGQNISNPSPAVFGGMDYVHDTGLFVGTWTSSEGVAGSSEVDLYGGFSKAFGDFGVTAAVYDYLYPSTPVDLMDSDIIEAYLSASFKSFSVAAFIPLQDQYDYMYYVADAKFGKFGAHVGFSDGDGSVDYTEANVSVAATSEVTFKLSMAFDDGAGVEEDPLLQVVYTKVFDIK